MYVGGAARSWDFDAVEPSMIDPDRPIDWQRPDRDGSSMPAWPSYAGLSPRCRAGYLQWLAGGRRDPEAHDEFPLLLLGGLERRLLEIDIDDGHPDVDCITTEVRALLDVYGPRNGTFSRCARSLLTRVDSVRLIDTDNPPPVWDPGHVPITIPVSVLIGVGRFVATAMPITAEWALCLLQHHPYSKLRTPALRCHDEFAALFTLLYRDTFGDGLVVTQRLPPIALSHEPASIGIRSARFFRTIPMPDVSHSNGPIIELQWLAARCTQELDPLSRHLGRHPDTRNDLGATALVPARLLATHGGTAVAALRHWLDETIGEEDSAVVTYHDLVQWWPTDELRLTRRTANTIATLLDKIGIGIDPDPRIHRHTPAPTITLHRTQADYRVASRQPRRLRAVGPVSK